MRPPSTAPIQRTACLLVLLLAGCSDPEYEYPPPPPPHPPRGEEVPIRRLVGQELSIRDPGVMVIRDGAAWNELWRRYPQHQPLIPPPVNFSRQMVAVVSRGSAQGCTNSAIYVGRVERGRDTLFVVLGTPADDVGWGEVTCAMEIAPVDAVAFERTELPVHFVGFRPGVTAPGPARWFEPGAEARQEPQVVVPAGVTPEAPGR